MKKMNLEELGKVSGGSILTLSPVFDNFAVEAYIPGGNLKMKKERQRNHDFPDKISSDALFFYPFIDFIF